ncbi:MAG: nuclear transport factor 2 family protein [Ignavibacteriae bacterium]|nr:nuclear transport factor 2 family protein [Ignavibacteriota bacterium]
MADIHPNIALVQKMYECFNNNDMETIKREVFAPDLVWNLPGRHPLSGTKHGADEVLAFFSQLVKANIHVTLDPAKDPATGVDTFGDDTVVEVHRGAGSAKVTDASGKTSEVVLNALNCTHYKIVNGRIAKVQVYISDQHTVDNFFWAVYSLKPIPGRLAD